MEEQLRLTLGGLPLLVVTGFLFKRAGDYILAHMQHLSQAKMMASVILLIAATVLLTVAMVVTALSAGIIIKGYSLPLPINALVVVGTLVLVVIEYFVVCGKE